MSFMNGIFGLLKKLILLVLILAVAIPLRYGSTDYRYLRVRLFHSFLSVKYSFEPDEARPTLSADYRAFETLVRMKPLFKGHSLTDALTIVKKIRASLATTPLNPKPSQCEINKEVFLDDNHSVDAYWINYPPRNFEKKTDRLLLYFHGGGYMVGDIRGYSGFECHLSKLFNVTILHLEYRLCPEHSLPAAVEDSVAIYRALLRNNISPSQLMIMGDSAGGGLTLLTIQALITHKLPVPQGVIVLSPWTDLTASGESHIRNRDTDVMLSFDQKDWVIEQLLGENHAQLSANDSIYSPLFGSFEKFPPMYINFGTAETLEDDSRRLMKKAEEANVDVTLEEGLHLMHVYPMFFSYFAEGRHSLDNINKWIQTKYDQKANE